MEKSLGTYWAKKDVVQSPSHVRLFTTPWAAGSQASLSLSISWSLNVHQLELVL